MKRWQKGLLFSILYWIGNVLVGIILGNYYPLIVSIPFGTWLILEKYSRK
jgi:hypothetical protein